MMRESNHQPDPLFRVGWIVLLVAAGLMTLNHLVLIFVLDQPVLFAGYTVFNLYALTVLALPFRRREGWAWSTTWLLPLGLAIPAVLDAQITAFYLAVSAVCVFGLLLTARAFGAQNRLAPTRMAGLALVLVLVSAALVGCQPIQAPPAAAAAEEAAAESGALPELTITVTADGIQVPAEVPAGPTVINLVNETGATGPEGGPVLPDVGRLTDGASMDELMALLPTAMQNPADVFSIFKMYGTAIAPTARLIWDLQPGNHVALVLGPAPLAQPFVVSESAAGSEVAADVSVQMQDFTFIMPDSVAAGPHLWQIENAGTQWHEFVVISKPEEMTVEEILAALPAEGPPTGPMPFEIVWGYVTISEGNRAWAEIDLPAGEYTVICFLPDLNTDMSPHAAHGMVRTLIVN